MASYPERGTGNWDTPLKEYLDERETLVKDSAVLEAGEATASAVAPVAADVADLQASVEDIVLAGAFTPQGQWIAQAYDALDVVYDDGTSWVATAATTAGDVPGVSALWVTVR